MPGYCNVVSMFVTKVNCMNSICQYTSKKYGVPVYVDVFLKCPKCVVVLAGKICMFTHASKFKMFIGVFNPYSTLSLHYSVLCSYWRCEE